MMKQFYATLILLLCSFSSFAGATTNMTGTWIAVGPDGRAIESMIIGEMYCNQYNGCARHVDFISHACLEGAISTSGGDYRAKDENTITMAGCYSGDAVYDPATDTIMFFRRFVRRL